MGKYSDAEYFTLRFEDGCGRVEEVVNLPLSVCKNIAEVVHRMCPNVRIKIEPQDKEL
jgi:hypothetical protein